MKKSIVAIIGVAFFSISTFAYEITYKQTVIGKSQLSCKDANKELIYKIHSVGASVTNKIKSVEFERKCEEGSGIDPYTQKATIIFKTKSIEGLF